MATVQYYVATSADGLITDRDGGLEWLLAFGFEEFQAHYDAFLSGVGALVMGSATYQFLLDQDDPWPYAELPTWVFTRRDLPRVEGADVRLVQGSPAAHHRGLVDSAGGRNVWMVGGGVLAAQFADAGVLDQLLVTVMPVVLGGGRPVLPVDRPLDLRLTGSTPFPSGAVEFAYHVVRPEADGQDGSATSSTTRVGSVSE
jgi:dihydrofolate reductase